MFHLMAKGVVKVCISATIGILCIRFTALEVMGVCDTCKMFFALLDSWWKEIWLHGGEWIRLH